MQPFHLKLKIQVVRLAIPWGAPLRQLVRLAIPQGVLWGEVARLPIPTERPDVLPNTLGAAKLTLYEAQCAFRFAVELAGAH